MIRASVMIAILCSGLQITSSKASPATRYAVGVLQRTFVRESPVWGPRTLRATIWYPAIDAADASRAIVNALPAEGRFPVVVYSHGGCGGAAKAVEPVALPIVSNGFVFVQFPHPGSTSDDCVSGGERYTRALLERPDDIVDIVNELKRLNDDLSWPLHGRVETSLVGIIGHSQGGQTALMMPARDPRVRATFSLSPSVAHPDSPPSLWDSIRACRVPVLIVHGERDATWTSEGPLKAYESLPAGTPKAYLEVSGMGHTPSSSDDIAFVVRYATALFQRYLKGDESAAAILAPSAAPATISFKGSLR
jgi:pimeloyl-ACP methyl ester carboxylesterase